MTERTAPPWRLFVAVPLPADLRHSLRDWVAAVRRDGTLDADWRWSDPDGWHVTLAFLGATPPDAVAGIAERLVAEVRGVAAFPVTAGGLGAFPSRGRARMLWYGIGDAEGRLADLAHATRVASGVDEGPFRPHVTLARARERHGVALPQLPVDGLPTGAVPVESVHLLRSHLGNAPARYQTLLTVPLASGVAAASPA